MLHPKLPAPFGGSLKFNRILLLSITGVKFIQPLTIETATDKLSSLAAFFLNISYKAAIICSSVYVPSGILYTFLFIKNVVPEIFFVAIYTNSQFYFSLVLELNESHQDLLQYTLE